MNAPARSPNRQTVSIDEIKDRLLGQIDAVVSHYGRPGAGAFRKGFLWFMLNPGRADRSVGSFCVHMSGAKAGRWYDYATAPRGGDLLDLIQLSLGVSPAEAIKEARAFLGLDTESPEIKRLRSEAAARAKQRRIQDEAQQARRAEAQQRKAAGLWLSGQAKVQGTPVDLYLKGRGIDLARFGHQPGAIRYHAECRYYWHEELTDPETGEVTSRLTYTPMPAMLSAITRGDKIIDCHRTYLAIRPDGTWGKAPTEDAKKVFGNYTGGAVRLSGILGPRGGLVRLNDAPQGSRVYVTEGIENGLSLIALRALTGRPPAFVIAAGMIWNLAHVDLPKAITEVVLCADNDSGDQARAALDLATATHAKAGRTVRIWSSDIPGEDLNDALRRALQLKSGEIHQ